MAEPVQSIQTLAAAVVSTAAPVRGRMLFVGWTEDGLPAAVPTSEGLGEEARAALAAFRSSGLAARRVDFSALVPAEYMNTGPAIDFADTPGRRAEDQVRYSVLDGQQAQRDVALGELAILDAITAARQPFQAPAPGSGGELALDTVPLYSLFAAWPGAPAGTGLAMLFRPTVEGHGNEAVFRTFVRLTLGRLLVLDESAPAGRRKGYLETAGRLAGLGPAGGFLHTLVTLRRIGFVEFSDEWLRGLQLAGRKAQGQFIRVLRAFGMVDISDEKHPVSVSTFNPEGAFNVAPGNQYGAHQPAEQVYDNKMFVTWFSGGLRVVDISNPYSPQEIGYYVPNPGRGQKTVKSNDVYRGANGLLYLIDRLDGLEILEYDR